jgi:hypothetical protein
MYKKEKKAKSECWRKMGELVGTGCIYFLLEFPARAFR